MNHGSWRRSSHTEADNTIEEDDTADTCRNWRQRSTSPKKSEEVDLGVESADWRASALRGPKRFT